MPKFSPKSGIYLLIAGLALFGIATTSARWSKPTPASSPSPSPTVAVEVVTPSPIETPTPLAEEVSTPEPKQTTTKSATQVKTRVETVETTTTTTTQSIAQANSQPTQQQSVSAQAESTSKELINYQITAPGFAWAGQVEGAGKTLGEVTEMIAKQHGSSINYIKSSYGWFITEIGGIANDAAAEKYWLYYLNGQFGQVAADLQMLKAGDTFSWKFGG